ncbi:MAG: sugar phosphate isomerase/epimerase [Verrucomicrobia bacterium]|nr:sugar phosphate isomerase/epimerase [Verrucomicrobiota bacterium]
MKLLKAISLLVLTSLLLTAAAHAQPKLGLQTWTCRNMTFEQMVDFAVKHKIKHLQCISKHMDPGAPAEETEKKKAVLDKHGLVCYTFGVAGTSMDKEKNRQLFEFAKFMGIKVIIVEPKNLAEWDNLEELVKEYDIKLAIHNHGRGTVYGDPETVKAVLAKRDRRIGACIDIGHVSGAGHDVAKIFREYDGRVYDLHLKDKKVEKADGKDVVLDVDIGTGISNYQGLFAELKKSKWDGVMAIETDNKGFAEDPNKFVEGAAKFFKANVK